MLFANRWVVTFWMLRRRLEEGTIALPEDPKLWDERRERLGGSPDRADAVAMAVEAVTYDAPKGFSFTL